MTRTSGESQRTGWGSGKLLRGNIKAGRFLLDWLLLPFAEDRACQAQSMEFSRQEYWSGSPYPPPGLFLTQRSNLGLLLCRRILYHWAARKARIDAVTGEERWGGLLLQLSWQRIHLQFRKPGSSRSPGEGNGNPLRHSCLRNPMDRGIWQATVLGVARVGHHLVTTTKGKIVT